MRTQSASHLDAPDGFRGLLALWVYLGHLSYAVDYQSYFLGMHALAVDLFMVLSGFLMVHTWKGELKLSTNWFQKIKGFYRARFFGSHLLVVLPITYWLFIKTEFVHLSPIVRLILGIAITAPIVIAVSFLLYRYVERIFIKLGKK